MRHMTNREIDGILYKIRDLKNSGSTGKMVAEMLIDSMCSYTSSVFEDNYKDANLTKLRESANSLEEYQAKIEEIELRRKSNHDELIGNIKMADMLCRRQKLPEIYGELPEEYKENIDGLMGEENRKRPGVVETRHAIADWAWSFMVGAVISMDIDINNLDYEKNPGDMQKIGEVYSAPKAKRRLTQMTEIGE
ncbi:MAG: DUF3232 domain-containing protein [Clostridia bacterium]|nr:DUF3232 domain-containing protein [Clostridia bacterium]